MVTDHNNRSNGERSMTVHSQADARAEIFEICRMVKTEAKKAYVKDKAGRSFMTICPTLRGPYVDIAVTRFKAEFSGICSLVRLGISFRVLMKSGHVFVRKHTKFEDKLQDIIVQWQDVVRRQAVDELDYRQIRQNINELQVSNDDMLEKLDRVIRGVARNAIGHKPFVEGESDA
jgi:hypothetical protein